MNPVWMWGGGCRGPGRTKGGRPWWVEAMGEPIPRAERGEIRYLVLEALAERPRHGYEIIQHIEQRAKNAYRPSPGVIYPTLQMLEELGHTVVADRDGRRVYEITDAGRKDLEANRGAVDDFYARFAEDPWDHYAEDFSELMGTVGRLLRIFKRGAQGGRMNASTMRAIRSALDDALQRIEEALNGPR